MYLCIDLLIVSAICIAPAGIQTIYTKLIRIVSEFSNDFSNGIACVVLRTITFNLVFVESLTCDCERCMITNGIRYVLTL